MKKMERMNLIKAFNKTYNSEAFFANLYLYLVTHRIEVDFLNSVTIATLLDDYYFFSHSGQKYISNLVNSFYDYENNTLTHGIDLAAMFWSIYGNNLIREWNNYTKEYDSIENYHMTESETSSDTNSGVDTSRESYPEYKEIVKQNHLVYDDTHSDIYGLDSGKGGAPANDVNTATEITTTPRGGGTELAGDTREIEGSKVNTLEHGKKVDGTRETEKAGTMPVGEGTIQGMISKDIELWQWNFYTKYLFPMVDKVLALPIY